MVSENINNSDLFKWIDSKTCLLLNINDLDRSIAQNSKDFVEFLKTGFVYVVRFNGQEKEVDLSRCKDVWVSYEFNKENHKKWYTREQINAFKKFYKSVKK